MRKSAWSNGSPREPSQRGWRETVTHVWMPPILSAALAATGAYLIATKTEDATKNKTYLDQRLKHADESVAALAEYVSHWRRLIVVCQSLVNDEQVFAKDWAKAGGQQAREQRKVLELKRQDVQAFAQGRPPKRDRLMRSLAHLKVYFTDRLGAAVDEFVVWDTRQQTKTCEQMPAFTDFDRHQAQIVRLLGEEVRR